MHDDDEMYFEVRAEEELELAQKATDVRVVSAHYQLACHYLDILYPNAVQQADQPSQTSTAAAVQAQ